MKEQRQSKNEYLSLNSKYQELEQEKNNLINKIDDMNIEQQRANDDLKYYKFRVFELKDKYEEEQSEDLISSDE